MHDAPPPSWGEHLIREESRIVAGKGLLLKELGHHPAYAVANVHVGFGVATVKKGSDSGKESV